MNKIFYILLLIPSLGLGQKIFVADNKKYAHFLVHKVRYFSEADWVIKKTNDYQKRSEPHHWYFVDHISNADTVIYYTDKREEAEHFVLFTDNLKLIGHYPAHIGNVVDPKTKRSKKL